MSTAFKQIFPQGKININYAQYFIGQSYLSNLAAIDEQIDVDVSNVTFEPGCHNHWHKHLHGYQILLVTAGQGWYQEADKPARLLNPGDSVVIHAGVKHWHGATKDSWFSHIAITKGQSEWLKPVDSSDYNNL
ncbi:cupin domain-containing protein [Snodgrassella sp. W8158]|uniref:cupin domain-containing protein n=1 Tax=Snodgrassella sp. W8158 TaxID=2751018 RepID=UPI0018DAFD97|nr:cupin domain-containing protein [Snodgrassella sp. W8158]MBI0180967.1 cupin domain-containing protein [Snodgrassella sp. W8158]